MDNTKPVIENVTTSSFAAMAGVLLSRASGVLRTIIVNASFGAGVALDAFNAAFRLPNSLRDLFADGALSAAFMTVLVEEKQKGFLEERRLIAIVFGFFSVITLALAVFGAVFSECVMTTITEQRFHMSGALPVAVMLFRLLVFYLPLTMANAIVMAILGVHNYPFRAMNGSFFLSLGMITGALLIAPVSNHIGGLGIYGLAIGALLGAILQMVYQMQPLLALNLIPLPILNPKVWLNYSPLRKIIRQMGPRALGQGAMILALSINTFFATQIGTGFLTYIVTAVTIVQVPIGLFGVATGFAALPNLVLSLSQNNKSQFSRLMVEGLETSLWLAGFTTICFSLLIIPFYVVLFQHGKITYYDTLNNCIAICIYSTGIVLASANKVLINTLYALDATRQIIYNAFIYLIINTMLNFFLVPKFGLLGIGFSFGVATSLDFWLNFLTIPRYFHSKGLEGSPYHFAGKHFSYHILFLNGLTFLLCFLGVWLIKHIWFYIEPNFWQALAILIGAGAILLGIFLLLILKLGPSHLKQAIGRLLVR